MTKIWALFILVTIHDGGIERVLPMDRFFASERQCQENADLWNEQWITFDIPRDHDVEYFCSPVEESGA